MKTSSRKDLAKKFNITSKAVIRLEKELDLFSSSRGQHRKFTQSMIDKMEKHIEDNYTLPKDSSRVGQSNCYVTRCGNIYKEYGSSGLYFLAKYDTTHDYACCGVQGVNKRVHRLVAKAFIPNPHNYPIVMHKDNNKANNKVENLIWGTVSMNTQQAYDDGLAKTAKGYEDCQSIAVHMFSLDHKIIKSFGSISEASRKTKISKSTISRWCINKSFPTTRDFYFRHQ